MAKTLKLNQAQRIQSLQNVLIEGGLIGRATLMSKLGLQYGTDRDVYQALGYKYDLLYDDYATRYLRQDIAKAVINRPVEATWRGPLTLFESDEEEDSELEKGWKELCDRLLLKSAFVRLDKLASLGKYGVLMLGFDDTNQSDDLIRPIRAGTRELLYVKPLSEATAKIEKWEENPASERYGLPLIYNVTTTAPGGTMTGYIPVHYTRMIHVPGELLESETEGVPILQAVYNRLMDLEKLVGASAEMFWRGARPGYHGKIAEGYQLTDTVKDDLQDQIDEYENNLRRILVNEGLELSPLAMQVADPANHVEVQIQMISAVTGIPKRILIGSERGELASSEDRTNWLELIQTRRQDYAEAQIIRPFITRCAQYGILPQPKETYKVVWTDIFAPSEKERAEIGKIRASALQSYMNNPAAELIVPPDIFYEYMLGLDDDDIEHVKKIHEETKEEEAILFAKVAAAKLAKPVQPEAEGEPEEPEEPEEEAE